jgi:glyoxylase-like metal-dependent hydrolase (beta-lactamase superfamily II)
MGVTKEASPMNRIALAVLVLVTGCKTSSHAVTPATLGTPSSTEALVALLDQPGPIELETVASADWEVPRAGLINLDNAQAKAAGLVDGPEPIQVYFHVLKHPTKGTWFVDSGMQSAYRDAPDTAAIRGLATSAMNLSKLKVHQSPGDWLKTHPEGVNGVLLTHLHLDHASGLPDLPASTAVYSGPGEAAASSFQNLVVQGNTDRELEGKGAINEWVYAADATGRFDGVLDVFGDGSVFALLVPGHTPGSTAYLVRTTKGPVLLTGDACHTRWGWDHDVEPGTFSGEIARSAVSFKKLKGFVAEHPAIDVRLGHQR